MNTAQITLQICCAAMLIGCSLAQQQSGIGSANNCYQCNSISDPINCNETFGTGTNVKVVSNCDCCTKSKNAQGWFRDCGTNTDCVPVPSSKWVCFDDKCNSATVPTQGFVILFLVIAAAFLVYFKRL